MTRPRDGRAGLNVEDLRIERDLYSRARAVLSIFSLREIDVFPCRPYERDSHDGIFTTRANARIYRAYLSRDYILSRYPSNNNTVT